MIERIMRDSGEHPQLFHWWGRLPKPRIEQWERELALSAPADLKLLWSTVGGGDLFESETILQPFGAAEEDLIVPVSDMFRKRGLGEDNFIFHKGLCISSFCKSGALLSTRDLSGLKHIADFGDLDGWYQATLRAEYGQRYGLEGWRSLCI